MMEEYTHNYRSYSYGIRMGSLSALGSALRKSFHSAYSMLLTIRNEGIVLPMSIYSVISYPKVRNNYDDS